MNKSWRRLPVWLIVAALAACATPEPTYQLRPGGPAKSKAEIEKLAKQEVAANQSMVKAGLIDKPLVPLSMTPPPYPKEAQRTATQGTVRVGFVIGVDGTVERIEILQSAGQVLDQACIDAVKTWRFAPATRNGKPTKVLAVMDFPFNMPQFLKRPLLEGLPGASGSGK